MNNATPEERQSRGKDVSSTIPKCPRQMIDQSKAKAMSRIVDGPGKTHDVSHAIQLMNQGKDMNNQGKINIEYTAKAKPKEAGDAKANQYQTKKLCKE